MLLLNKLIVLRSVTLTTSALEYNAWAQPSKQRGVAEVSGHRPVVVMLTRLVMGVVPPSHFHICKNMPGVINDPKIG